LRLALRDDREDFDGFVPDVIEHPDVAYSEAELWFRHPSQSLDSTPAHLGWLVSQVRLQRIAELGALSCGQRPKGLNACGARTISNRILARI
jgi:hypothetical protein